LGENEVRELAQAILEGTDDPLAKHGEHEKLVERLRALKREEAAVSQALPQAEESLRLTVYENQHRWLQEADEAFEKAMAAERKAYQRALEIIEGPRRKRLYAEALGQWIRNVGPAFGTPDDVAGRSAIQRLQADAEGASEKHAERLKMDRWQAAETARLEQEGVA
jgi:hypothetical protein